MFSFRNLLIYFVIFYFLSEQIVHSQNKFEILPGNRIGTIKIGDCKDSILKIIKSKYIEKTFLEEKTNFSDSDLTVLPQFVLGFDKVFIFDDFPVYQVFKVYLKKDSLNCIMITSYGFGSEKAISKYKIQKKLGFYDNQKKVIKLYGEPDKKIILKTNEIDYIYCSKGIEFIFEDDQLVVINIFKPINKTIN